MSCMSWVVRRTVVPHSRFCSRMNSRTFSFDTASIVSRDYTDIPALRDMSFTVPDGQILGYIGPNGPQAAREVTNLPRA